MYCDYFISPIGILKVEAGKKLVEKISFVEEKGVEKRSECTDFALVQLFEYFYGTRTAFTLPLKERGRSFQKRVWHEIARIPFGETRSYSEIASACGNASACRAAANAVAKNPFVIVIPCHRVVAKNGIGGYGGGIPAKEYLLDMEQKRK